jgi:hypothetical protein
MLEMQSGIRASAYALALVAFPAQHSVGEVTGVSTNGFEVHEQVHVNAGTAAVWSAIIEPKRWWNSAHSYSGHAANFTLEATAGGCWCERLEDGGSVQHLTVVYVSPGKAIRLRGGLGPLQSMAVDGVLTIKVNGASAGTDLMLDYAVGGYSKDGFENLSKAVDSVLGDQVARVKRLLETGTPDSARP